MKITYAISKEIELPDNITEDEIIKYVDELFDKEKKDNPNALDYRWSYDSDFLNWIFGYEYK